MKLAADTSVIVAAFASWHESHERARRAIDAGAALIAHCALETYSVLTRLPTPHRAPGELVAAFLVQRFPAAPLTLPGAALAKLLSRFASEGIAGGAVYDALVAATADHHGRALVTLDLRARAVYQRLGVEARFVG